MDPRTGEPANTDLLSVSVFGDDGLSVDAVSSALFVMGRQDSLEWLRRNPKYAAVMIDRRWPSDPNGLTVTGDLQVMT
jgi:thiamine biosynthesis lipoprotein